MPFPRLLVLLLPLTVADLLQVQVLFRHGDRAPSQAYPRDPYNQEGLWPNGWSQLTQRGYAQSLELGEFLRERYVQEETLVDGHFERSLVNVRSSDKDRCIETAQLVARGLFPDSVVPVHTFSHYKHDLLLKPTSLRCDRHKELVRKDKALLEKRLQKKYSKTFAHLSLHTGWNVDWKNVADVYNAVFRENENGLVQPTWTRAVMDERENRTAFDDVVELKRRDRMEQFNSAEKARLVAGFLTHQLLDNMLHSKKRMLLFSSHDATLTALMYNLGVSNEQIPSYTSAFILELHEEEGRRFTRLFFRNSTGLFPLSLADCSHECPLDVFSTFLASRSLDSREAFEEACQNGAATVFALPLRLLLLLFVSVIVLRLLIVFAKRRLSSRH